MVIVACFRLGTGPCGLADGRRCLSGCDSPRSQAGTTRSRGGDIAVLGTRATVRSNAYRLAIEELEPGRTVHQIACPLFVPLIEEGWLEHEVTERVAMEYVQQLVGTDVDTVVLGYTHYPLLQPLCSGCCALSWGAMSTLSILRPLSEAAVRLLQQLPLERDGARPSGILRDRRARSCRKRCSTFGTRRGWAGFV